MKHERVYIEEIHQLNDMYIDCVLTLPIDFLIERFNLTYTMILAIREIPPGKLSKLTHTNQFLIEANQCVLSKLLQLP